MSKRDRIRVNEREIRRIHALGLRAMAQTQKAGGNYTTGVASGIAAKEKVSESLLRKAIKFAQVFSGEELKKFLRLRTPDGSPLTISVAYKVMYVTNYQRRASIARLAAENGWAIRDVEAEVKLRVGVDEKASKGGRRPRLPANLAEALRQLDEKCDQWNRWITHFEARGEEASEFSAARLPSKLKTKIQAVTLAMIDLAKEVANLQ